MVKDIRFWVQLVVRSHTTPARSSPVPQSQRSRIHLSESGVPSAAIAWLMPPNLSALFPLERELLFSAASAGCRSADPGAHDSGRPAAFCGTRCEGKARQRLGNTARAEGEAHSPAQPRTTSQSRRSLRRPHRLGACLRTASERLHALSVPRSLFPRSVLSRSGASFCSAPRRRGAGRRSPASMTAPSRPTRSTRCERTARQRLGNTARAGGEARSEACLGVLVLLTGRRSSRAGGGGPPSGAPGLTDLRPADAAPATKPCVAKERSPGVCDRNARKKSLGDHE
ncbi:hypothetical protein BJ982_007034 [Sphaerisporangium siamense]|uniref:Uncharacterized protein n=1 Tax=Sphaerisporangium siamense TaxID=795645 RepID=A0A7W7GDY5_9ACTN|nr:hypothetical protein [Sphaerisporangium siamense]